MSDRPGRAIVLAILLAAGPALAGQEQARPGEESEFERKAEGVLRQPLKDLGIMVEKAPEVLLAAQAAPYSLSGIHVCRDYRREIAVLDEILGPDIDALDDHGEPLTGRLAEAGAKSIVSGFIPFRGLVREATGAADADRRLRAALAAGVARRSFLKGHALGRGCKR